MLAAVALFAEYFLEEGITGAVHADSNRAAVSAARRAIAKDFIF